MDGGSVPLPIRVTLGDVTEPLGGRDGTQAAAGGDALAASPRLAGTDPLAAPAPGDGGAHEPAMPSADPAGRDEPALPSLPPLAPDHAAVARWMDEDAAAARRATGRGAGRPAHRGDSSPTGRHGRPTGSAVRSWIEAEIVDPRAVDPAAGTVAPARDVPPPRVIPRPTPAPDRGGRMHGTPPPPASHPEPGAWPRATPSPSWSDPRRAADASDDPEPEWLRRRREEHEFRAEFGEWREGPPSGGPTGTGGAPTRGGGLSATTLLILLAVVVIIVMMALG